MSDAAEEYKLSPYARAFTAIMSSGISFASQKDRQTAIARIEAQINEAVQVEVTTLASALRKFAPDLMLQIVERYSLARGELEPALQHVRDEFLKSMKESAHG